MFWFIASSVIGAATLIGYALVRAGMFDEEARSGELVKKHRNGVPVLIGGLVLLLVVTVFASYHQVPAGHVGLVYQFGEIVGETQDGAQFIPPWQSLRTVNVQVQYARFHEPSKEDKDALGEVAAASSETQNVFFDVTVNYQLDHGRVKELYTNVGPQWFDRLIPSRVQQFFKAEIVNYAAVDVTTHREQIRADVTKALDDELNTFGISVVAIQVDNVHYNTEFESAIEQKQVATQDALRAEAVVAQKEAEARQKVAEAEGDAQSTVTRAKGQSEANRELAASLTPALLQSQAIAKMDGLKVAILPSGGNFLLDPANLLKDLGNQP